MALKTLPELQYEIDRAVHPNGPQGKTRAAGLNTVLKSLATELTTQQRETAQALADKTDLLGKDNTWTGPNYFGKGIRFYGGNGFDEYGQLYLNQLVVGNKYSWRDHTYTLAKDSTIVWKPTDYTSQQGAPDVGLGRVDAGVLEVNTGTPGNPATLTTLDIIAKAAPPALNSIAKLAAATQALTDKGDLLGNNNTWTGTNYFGKGIRFYGDNGFDEYGQLYVNQLVIGNKYSWRDQAYTLAKDSAIVWKATDYTSQQGAPDVGLIRMAAGVLEVNTGTPGSPATLTTLDIIAQGAPPTLNSVIKLAEALSHKADLDASGRVSSSQLPSYVDDIVEANDFATLPLPGEASKVYVTLDTNKQYRWAGTAYALLSDSGLTTTIKAGLEAATNPSASNAFATLADLVTGNEAKATLVTTGHRRTPYFGTGTVSNTDEDGLKKALAAAQPGDTVQQLSLARIAAPYRTGEQIKIPAGVNYDTGGFDIDATGYCDGIILVGGTGVIHGGNATISHNVNGSWGIGWYGGGTLDYRIYDLSIRTAVDGREYFANPFAIYLPECRVYHTGSITSAAPLAIYTHNSSGGVGNQYEHVGPVTGFGNGSLFGIGGNGRVIQRGDVIVTENATAGTIDSGASLTMHGGELDLRSAQLNAGFKLDPAGALNLIDVTVLGDQMPALLKDANQAAGATVHLYGTTVVPALPWPAGITVVDHRPITNGVMVGNSDVSLEFAFNAGFANNFTVTATRNQAATYATHLLSNVDSVTYIVNGAPINLPFSLDVGDTLLLSITRQDDTKGAVVQLAS